MVRKKDNFDIRIFYIMMFLWRVNSIAEMMELFNSIIHMIYL